MLIFGVQEITQWENEDPSSHLQHLHKLGNLRLGVAVRACKAGAGGQRWGPGQPI